MVCTSGSPKDAELGTLLESIREQFELILGDSEQVAQDCSRAAGLLASPPDSPGRRFLTDLAEALREVEDEVGQPACDLIVAFAAESPEPWKLLRLLLRAENPAYAAAGLDAVLESIAAGRLALDNPVLKDLAALLERLEELADDSDLLARMAAVIDTDLHESGGLAHLLTKGAGLPVRRLAARLLDVGGGPIGTGIAGRVLGEEAYGVLRPYLEFTLATHADLMLLAGSRAGARTLAAMFRAAEEEFGPALVREAVAQLGWQRVRLGMRITPYVELSGPGLLPIVVRSCEAGLFADGSLSETARSYLVTAHGGALDAGAGRRDSRDPVDRFRRMNLQHAELLGEILDVAPLDTKRARRIVRTMDSVVETFASLFRDSAAECEILPGVWSDLRERVLEMMDGRSDTDRLGPEPTRLVLAFEDPANLGEVRSVHGLKRYLHQKGLKLGFELVGTDHAPDRTVDLLLIRGDGQQVRSSTLRYIEFEAGGEPDPDPWIPFPVRMAVDGLARQLVQGTESFPGVDAFLFGNEVHYYVSFRNHPVFLRIDYSPPQRGGMIDLEYFGVSNYELDLHPNLELDGICEFFRKLEFDVRMSGTRLFVRYDKERSSDLGDLLRKAESVFLLLPFLMDVDWIVGSLQLPAEARRLVIAAWAERFRAAGVLPVDRILDSGRKAIVVETGCGPAGTEERIWKGKAPYADRCSSPAPEGLLAGILRALEEAGLPAAPWSSEAASGSVPLREIERNALAPLREAIACGRVEWSGGRLRPAPAEIFALEHEADRFAQLLSDGGEPVLEAIAMSRPLAELERFVEFGTTGYVGGLKVGRARVVVRGGEITVYVARDRHGVIRMGFFTTAGFLFRGRAKAGARWRSNIRHDCGHFWSLLIGANYVTAASAEAPLDSERDLAQLREIAEAVRPADKRAAGAPERILGGMRVAPGRAVGPALFGTEGRQPADLDGAVLVASEVRPTDNPFLFRSAGVISTGGALLSHAALLAIQFGKPAILAQGRWTTSGHRSALLFSTSVYREIERRTGGYAVCVLELVEERTEELVEEDLVILDADGGTAEVLGQGRDTATLWDNLRLLGEADVRSRAASSDSEVMAARAQQMRARHQIEKVLGRVADPTLAGFAAHELAAGRMLGGVPAADRARLISLLLANPAVAGPVAGKLATIAAGLAEACREAERSARERIPVSLFLYEIVGLRLRYLRSHRVLEGLRATMRACDLPDLAESGDPQREECSGADVLDEPARLRLEELAAQLLAGLGEEGPRRRHLLRRLERIDRICGLPPTTIGTVRDAAGQVADEDGRAVERAGRAWVLTPSECGLETHPRIGWKAANLAEVDRLVGRSVVPDWFVVTDHAFGRMLDRPADPKVLPPGCGLPPGATLGQAIETILRAEDLEDSHRSACIRALWGAMELPDELVEGVRQACARLEEAAEGDLYLALRSSSCDEDSETQMRAGEFDTYLFVRGADAVLEHLKLTWSGFWTERAICSRRADGNASARPAGGVVVQRMVRSRVSGVLQTVNVGSGDLQEMLINVGLGQGEGIVSGRVAADLVTVIKDFGAGEDPVHFNYLTNDKIEQVVFDEKRGSGTRIEETLYHQRLRPAIEYTELSEIARLAVELEEAYGYPLDVEFALEGDRLWLLQARPIAIFSAELEETLDHHPLTGGPIATGPEGVDP